MRGVREAGRMCREGQRRESCMPSLTWGVHFSTWCMIQRAGSVQQVVISR